MAKKPAKPRKPSRRTTTKKVQDTENEPLPIKLPDVTVKPEEDEDGWGADGLTLKQKLFVEAYIGPAAGNASKAAQMAGYRDDNRPALAVTACENLRKPNVQRAIARAVASRLGQPEWVRAGIAEIANGNAADYMRAGPDGELHPDLKAMAEAGALGLIQQINEERLEVGPNLSTVKLKLKLYDRLKALEILAKMNGQLKEQHQHSGTIKFHPITFDGDKTISDDDDAG